MPFGIEGKAGQPLLIAPGRREVGLDFAILTAADPQDLAIALLDEPFGGEPVAIHSTLSPVGVPVKCGLILPTEKSSQPGAVSRIVAGAGGRQPVSHVFIDQNHQLDKVRMIHEGPELIPHLLPMRIPHPENIGQIVGIHVGPVDEAILHCFPEHQGHRPVHRVLYGTPLLLDPGECGGRCSAADPERDQCHDQADHRKPIEQKWIHLDHTPPYSPSYARQTQSKTHRIQTATKPLTTPMNPAYRTVRFLLPNSGTSPLPETFAVVTACNPHGRILNEQENRKRVEALRQLLTATPFPFFAVTGCSPDQSHAEPGFGIVCGLEDALELATVFDQEAIYWIEGGWLDLVHRSGSPRERLDHWKARVLRGG